MEERTHHPFGFSTWGRRFACPASAKEEAKYPAVVTDDAQEGIDLHALMASGEDSPDEAKQELLERCRAKLEEWYHE